MQVHTERGLISIDGEYQSAERAQMDGYTYAWYSQELGCDLYSKALDEEGHRHSFVKITGFC